jgi:DNA-binding NarL/FixJ family response regulator
MNETVYILADSQDISKAGIRFFLKENGFDGAVADVPGKRELIDFLAKHPAAVVVLDYTTFDFPHIEDLLIVASRFPEVEWLLFSEELSFSFLKRISIEANFGILLKNSSAEEIRLALALARKHEKYFCPRIAHYIASQDAKDNEKQILTSSEQEILKMLALGKSVKEIADERCSSVHTIATHKKNIFRKLEVNTVFEARKYALRSGLVDAMDYYI